ncbi:YlzJ-like family protein [Virgibacillus sp. W0430]|uniref:YlzJ-like family protein n=1 Tax=Virgibacillus sp. W0430 TaxID=3391580 RepID=UPI003F467F06
MILYTPLCETDVFPVNSESSQQECLTYQGKTILAEKNSDGAYQVIQLLSTDPDDFLNESYIPGSVLSTEYIGKKE